MAAPRIQPYEQIVPMIYAYTTPGYPSHDGWIKIGYAEKQDVLTRIKQQLNTADIDFNLEWQDFARYKDASGEVFDDKDFHAWLTTHKNVPRKPKKEWFQLSPSLSQQYFNEFASRKYQKGDGHKTYVLRQEQQKAVNLTKSHFEADGEQFLWNAKPRFGKTLAAYELVKAAGFKNVLILTNRPSIANSWADDFKSFIKWEGEYAFISDTDALAGKGVYTRDEYLKTNNAPRKVITFQSLQGLKGSLYFGGNIDKLKWMTEVKFDLVIIDESHEGVDTGKTDFALEHLNYEHVLYLSGTPFKQLASAKFSASEIFNWSYADEQEAREGWNQEEGNPYLVMPRLNLFTYNMSDIVRQKAAEGIEIDGETFDYAFDLNEFFATHKSSKKFVYEDAVRQFVNALATQEKFPFSTPELRESLSHTLWHMTYIDSAKALKKMLEEHEVFKDYEIILATGDGSDNDDDLERSSRKVIDRVRDAIRTHDKTITITVGQLTVGITIPEWTGVMMLCNMKSPASYMQAAFRAQTPYATVRDGKRWRKENAYVFDFDPARTLDIYDKFASNHSSRTASGGGTVEDRKYNVARLLNFLPVLGEDPDGEMVELNAEQVLTIPRHLKSQAVVESKFMSNLLFNNISNIFGTPRVVRDILEKLQPTKEFRPDKSRLEGLEEVPVDEYGEVAVDRQMVVGLDAEIFGDKIYDLSQETQEEVRDIVENLPSREGDRQVIKAVSEKIKEDIVKPIADSFGLGSASRASMERRVKADVEDKMGRLQKERDQKIKIAKNNLQKKNDEASTPNEVKKNKDEFEKTLREIETAHTREVIETTRDLIESRHAELVEQAKRQQLVEMKREKEEEIRSYLRGFTRTIPSFLMAYGDNNITLANFDSYLDEDVFEEVAGITMDNFRFLRDGGDFEEDGVQKHYKGQAFDEIVFNDSMRAFMEKKRELANYFDEGQTQDIFDFIPPQKTNQVFTPRSVVMRMINDLERQNPGCFDKPDATFADLYMKSGMYITEIVKRLYKSDGLKKAFPDGRERIRHILEEQVYGMAPTKIIYLIAVNYILGFDEEMKNLSHNFALADTVSAAKSGTLEDVVDKDFTNGK